MAKIVKVSERCVMTTDDKGQRSLVANAKEVLTTMSKNGIDVSIFLIDTPKDAAAKFLKENNVPYKALLAKDDKEAREQKFDCCVLPSDKVVLLRDNWKYTMEDIVNKLYRNDERKPDLTVQDKMDNAFKDYKKWTDEANKRRAGVVG